MAEVIEAYKSLTASDELKELERMMEKAAHDEASALYDAENKKAAEIAKKMRARGTSVEDIAEDTGLTVEEILKL